tara:strand:+ start:1809 stop:2267 length:459 start_codon:yes stop_codon:yes gene_type:complete
MKILNSLSSNQRLTLNVLIPSLYFVPLVVAYFSPKNFGFGHRWLVHSGLWIGTGGMVIWVLSIWYLGSSFATLPGTKELVYRGIYRFVRHPMYLGISATVFGLMLACGSFFGMVYLITVILPLNFVRSRMEDQVLEDLFGAAFNNYKKSTWF